MKCLKRFLIKEAIDSISQSIAHPIHSNKSIYLPEKGIPKLGWRAFRRLLAYRLSGQKKYLVKHIKPQWKKCLWLYYDIPQIGDALMDLAPRSLLNEHGIQIDLFCPIHIASLFADDQWLNRVESDKSKINAKQYDFVIVSSMKWRSIRHKIYYAWYLPWLSIFGKFSGPEINRSLYSTKKIVELLNTTLTRAQLSYHAHQKLSLTKITEHSINNVDVTTIAIGGADSTRTYRHWYEVVLELKKMDKKKVVLVGSENGVSYAEKILSLEDDTFEIKNLVGETSLKECQKIMQESSLIIAADGGLMHLAISTNKPVLSLFNNAINPIWRLPDELLALSIQAKSRDINTILPEDIINMVKTAQQHSA
ncbi:glycosyltransferase family 9 protein [Methyloradius palustris]|uniref:Uncharacterized protein n=1 Tax=Methyloradius palustris TaxID=2778876 RepID=A0A8D5JVY8_9PROT|nr:glycosyltransferase family 9 protein [Methyloradius palustris]BCM24569.1 hypothetical protein ZMTM_08280 [Methyloradius palustris]